jgi:hypothetical protein
MKIPEIKGRNKIRNAQICRLWLTENLTQEEIAKQFNMTQQGIGRILYKNKELLKLDKDYEKSKRIHYLGRMLLRHDMVLGKKSSIDIIDGIRKEIEGDKPLVDNSVHQQIIMFRNPEALKENIGTRAENRVEAKDAELSPR